VGATAAVFDLLDLAVFHPFLVSLHEDLLVDPVQADLVLVVQVLASQLALLPVFHQAFRLGLH